MNSIYSFTMCNNNPCPNRLRTDKELDQVVRYVTSCHATVWQRHSDIDLNREWGARVIKYPSQSTSTDALMITFLASSRKAYIEGFNRHLRLFFEFERRHCFPHEWSWIMDNYLDEPPDELPQRPDKDWGERGVDRPGLVHPANVALCERCRFDHPNSQCTSIPVAKHDSEGAKVYQHPGGK